MPGQIGSVGRNARSYPLVLPSANAVCRREAIKNARECNFVETVKQQPLLRTGRAVQIRTLILLTAKILNVYPYIQVMKNHHVPVSVEMLVPVQAR